MSDGTYSVSVAAVITNHLGEVLVVRRRENGQWELPGGVLELAESIEEGLRREVREEAGRRIHIDELSGVYHHSGLEVLALVYRCGVVGTSSRRDEETSDVCWMKAHEAARVMPDSFGVRVLDALHSDEHQSLAKFRRHNGDLWLDDCYQAELLKDLREPPRPQRPVGSMRRRPGARHCVAADLMILSQLGDAVLEYSSPFNEVLLPRLSASAATCDGLKSAAECRDPSGRVGRLLGVTRVDKAQDRTIRVGLALSLIEASEAHPASVPGAMPQTVGTS